MEDFLYRVGVYFFLLAVGFFLLFVASDWSGVTNFDYFCTSLLLFGIGWYFMRRGAPPPPQSGRFATLRRWRQAWRERRQKKAEGQKKK
ncbi:MAG: hypothetical protein WHS87_03615 [Anaerolineales bacterium]